LRQGSFAGQFCAPRGAKLRGFDRILPIGSREFCSSFLANSLSRAKVARYCAAAPANNSAIHERTRASPVQNSANSFEFSARNAAMFRANLWTDQALQKELPTRKIPRRYARVTARVLPSTPG
jgi:hypothetical protein